MVGLRKSFHGKLAGAVEARARKGCLRASVSAVSRPNPLLQPVISTTCTGFMLSSLFAG